MSTGMLRFADNDNALALIIGYETAHITLDHVGKSRKNAVLGAIVGAAISGLSGVDVTDAGAMAFSKASNQKPTT